MVTIHFLNVGNGDCSWIEHESGRNTVIDICNGNDDSNICEALIESHIGNMHQKFHPVNPITYFRQYGLKEIFRFILTHPDMDHMDGIKNLFEEYDVINFWDTENTKEMRTNTKWGKYREDDWEFYQDIRRGELPEVKVLYLYSGSTGYYYNLDKSTNGNGDGLTILAPSRELVSDANETQEYNELSYVIMLEVYGKKIIFGGDSDKNTWDYILNNQRVDITNIDVLIAPHHGRKSGGNDTYLEILKPRLTLFGNAESGYLDYASWNNRGLEHITNNEAGNIILTVQRTGIKVYVTNLEFAKKKNHANQLQEYKGAYLYSKI